MVAEIWSFKVTISCRITMITATNLCLCITNTKRVLGSLHYSTSSYSPAFFVLVPTQGIYIGNIGIFSFLQGSTLGMSTLSDYIYRHIDTTGDLQVTGKVST